MGRGRRTSGTILKSVAGNYGLSDREGPERQPGQHAEISAMLAGLIVTA